VQAVEERRLSAGVALELDRRHRHAQIIGRGDPPCALPDGASSTPAPYGRAAAPTWPFGASRCGCGRGGS
jgi:hypothetical protein